MKTKSCKIKPRKLKRVNNKASKIKENAKFILDQFGYSKSTIIFKINIVKLINKHPKIKNYSL